MTSLSADEIWSPRLVSQFTLTHTRTGLIEHHHPCALPITRSLRRWKKINLLSVCVCVCVTDCKLDCALSEVGTAFKGAVTRSAETVWAGINYYHKINK